MSAGNSSASRDLSTAIPLPQSIEVQEAWQILESIWKNILGLEGGIESLRLSLNGLRAELESAFRRQLTVEEKLHALQADIAVWTKAKNRVHYVLPKVREFIHHATWAAGSPERKRLEEVFQEVARTQALPADLSSLREQLEHLQKDRQVLQGQGNTVAQEARSILAEVQRTLNTLIRNSMDRARNKRSAGREKGKYF
jgi:DNA repair exonuclease SbcCD ATPase subunit